MDPAPTADRNAAIGPPLLNEQRCYERRSFEDHLRRVNEVRHCSRPLPLLGSMGLSSALIPAPAMLPSPKMPDHSGLSIGYPRMKTIGEWGNDMTLAGMNRVARTAALVHPP